MGDRFIGFDRFAKASLGSENDTMKGKPIDKLEMELSPLREIQGGDAKFLLSFADCGLKSRLAGFQATAWPIDLASAQPSFLSDHQDLPILSNETEGSPHRRLPILPEIIHALFYLTSPCGASSVTRMAQIPP
jgi:hypothetical protein